MKKEETTTAKVIFELDYYEDRDEIRLLVNAGKYYSAVEEARNMIRFRLKYEEGISEAEEKFLERLSEELYIPE